MKFFGKIYLFLIALICFEKAIQMFSAITLWDVIVLGVDLMFFISAYFCFCTELSIEKKIFNSVTVFCFIAMHGVLSMAYFFGNDIRFYFFSVLIVTVFCLPIAIISYKRRETA